MCVATPEQARALYIKTHAGVSGSFQRISRMLRNFNAELKQRSPM